MTHHAAIAVVVFSLCAAPLAAQSVTDPARPERGAESHTLGTIKTVVTFEDPAGMVGVHLDLLTAEGLVSVHLAPAMFIGTQNFWFFADDKVEIVGTRTTYEGNAAIWATAIRKGASVLALRSADGTPKWTPSIDGTDGCGVNHALLPHGTER
jgi:hypothetical protein